MPTLVKTKYELQSGETLICPDGFKIHMKASIIDAQGKPVKISPKRVYRLRTNELVTLDEHSLISWIDSSNTYTKMAFSKKSFWVDNPGIKNPNDEEQLLKDGSRKVIAVDGLKVKNTLLTWEDRIPIEQGVHQLEDGRHVVVGEGGVILRITGKDQPKPKLETRYAAYSSEVKSKRDQGRQMIADYFRKK